MTSIDILLTDHLDLWTSAIAHRSVSGRGRSKKFSLHGIEKLRGLILDLAVRGKLVPQDPEDEPAAELLKQIRSEKVRLLRTNRLKEAKALPEPGARESVSSLPRGWVWSQLGAVGFISPRNLAADAQEASFVPMPMIASEYGVANEHEVRPWGEIKKGYTHFAEGDVGLAKITPCFENGKSTVFRGLTGGIGSGTTELHILRPVIVDPDYLLIFLKSPSFIAAGIPKMTGTAGQKRVPTEFFANSPFPLPPLAEQSRIVGKVDELMALCDRLEAGAHEAIEAHQLLVSELLATLTTSRDAGELADNWALIEAHFDTLIATEDSVDQLKQTILQLAVMGRLVRQDPNDEPAAELLKRIKAAKVVAHEQEKLSVRSSQLKQVSKGVNFKIPRTWAITSFDDVFLIVSGITKGQKVPPSEAIELPYLRVANVQRGFLDLTEIKSIAVKSSDARRYELRRGDILMTEGGDWDKVGRAAIWSDEIERCIHQNHVFRIRPPSEEIQPEWVISYVNSAFGKQYFQDASKQTTNLASINKTQLRFCPLPVPPLAEQNRILAKIDSLFKLCERLKSGLMDASDSKMEIADAVVAKAIG
ncbi:restriction endonuclease subunit S [Mesorhizobium australicum]|uniref:restriction endonuclease subunit S n=1 Tax=Mesorhizobium australicum TaxID=536018 RepID=UPI00333C3EBC